MRDSLAAMENMTEMASRGPNRKCDETMIKIEDQ